MDEESTRIQPRRQVVRYRKARVEVVSGADGGLVHEANDGPVRVGASRTGNDLVLTDQTVSRHHLELTPTPQGVRVRDAGSTNGVFANGVRIFDAVFGTNVDLQIGSTALRVVLLPDGTDRELSDTHRFGDLLGSSPRMRALFADLERIAPKDVSLLIEGETGTGKEVVAESVHRKSARAGAPFVVFDCSAVVATLVESALFGHERGAFTGALSAHMGVFEQANGGTIFLDELGELPLELQKRLLRVLQSREVIRLGAQRSTPVDVRVIAATNRNLMQEVQKGRFREDLYYRIAAMHVLVPPLRERLEDLPQLVEHFLSQADPPQSASGIPGDVWAMFRAHRWPGNVRELQNVLQRFVVMPERLFSSAPAASSATTPATIPATAPGAPAQPAAVPAAPARRIEPLQVARRHASEAFERNYLDELMRQAKGNVPAAAGFAEVSRQMLYKMLRKQRIDAPAPDDGTELE